MKRYCEYCGKKMKKQDSSLALFSNQSQYMYKCKKGHIKYYSDFINKPVVGQTIAPRSIGGWVKIPITFKNQP